MSSVTAPKPSAQSHGSGSAASLLAYNAIMIIIPTVSVSLRFWSRALSESGMRRRFWWDDWAILAALPFCITVNALAITMVHLGAAVATEGLKVVYGMYFVYFFGLTFAKSSALFFYSRIFGKHSKPFNYALWATHGLVWAWFIAITFATIFSCNPVQKSYNPYTPGTCISVASVWLGTTTVSVLTDFIILLLPLPMLWGLKLKLSRKIMTCIVFLCGYSSITFSLGRLISVFASGGNLHTNSTWGGAESLYWIGGEIPITILSACLPSLFFLYRRVRKHGMLGLFKAYISDANTAINGSGGGTIRGGTVRMGTFRDHNDIEEQDIRKSSYSSLGEGSSTQHYNQTNESIDSYSQRPMSRFELEAKESQLEIEVTHEFHVEHVDLSLLGGGFQPDHR